MEVRLGDTEALVTSTFSIVLFSAHKFPETKYHKNTLTIFFQMEQKLLLCHLWWFQDLDLQQRHGSDLKKNKEK